MRPSNHNGYYASTIRLFEPTNGKCHNKQMIDMGADRRADKDKKARSEEFRRRWLAALSMNEMTNAEFAARLGPLGGQKVHNWIKRGKVGQESVPMVRDMLKRTNMDWLQEGIGEPERLSITKDTPPKNVNPQSYVTRLPPAILAKAVRVMEAEEHLNGRNPPLKHANLLLHYCDRIAAGESVADLIAEIANG